MPAREARQFHCLIAHFLIDQLLEFAHALGDSTREGALQSRSQCVPVDFAHFGEIAQPEFLHPAVALAEHLRAEVSPPDATETSLMTELDKVDGLLSALSPDNPVRSLIAIRFRDLLKKIGDPGDHGVARELSDATDEEMLEFIHHELGRPSDD